MSRVFESAIENISKKSGYHYNFLVDMFNEMMNDEGQDFDWDQFEQSQKRRRALIWRINLRSKAVELRNLK